MSTPTEKEFTAARAEFAMKGHSLIRGETTPHGGHDFIVICWSWPRYCEAWHEVLDLLDKIGRRA